MSVIEAPAVTEPIAEPFEVPEYDEYEKAALNYINKVRGILGFGPIESLPRGIRNAGSRCVVAQGIKQDAEIAGTIYQYSLATLFHTTENMGRVITLANPDHKTAAFIISFDEGYYPQHELP